MLTGAPEKDSPWKAQPAASYAHKQTTAKITIAADAFATPEKAEEAFGKKANPVNMGLLPVLLVIQNDSDETLQLDNIKLELVSGNNRLEPTPARDLPYLRGARRPDSQRPIDQLPIPKLPGRGKNPLQREELQSRAFSARMVPPHDSASGFIYFQASFRPDMQVYINGLRQMPSGKELFYFEIPLQ